MVIQLATTISQAFEFNALDQLESRDEPGYDPTKDLRVLKEMWLEKLTKSGEPLYRQSGLSTWPAFLTS